MEAQQIFYLCKAYEDGKIAAEKKQISSTNPFIRNTAPWLAWIYGWEYGSYKFIKKYQYIN